MIKKKYRYKTSAQLAKELQDIKLSKSLSKWFILQTLLIVGVGGFTTIFVDIASKYLTDTDNVDAVRVVGIVSIFLVIVGIFMLLEYRIMKRHLETVCNMIESLAGGDYTHKLKVNKFTIFKRISIDLNKLADELQNVQMLRSDFVNSYSHEFKTPIASIKGFAQLLLEDDSLPEDTKKQYLQIIVDESERLTGLAGNTILLSQLDTLTIIANRKPYSLDEQLRRCTIMLSNEIAEKKIKVDGDEITEVTYFGNEDWMQHLWLNLLNNAVKFTPEGGRIKVSSLAENGRIYISIADSGIGMTQETADQIFKKYYRANTKDPQRGLGLGLSIAHKIVKLCGGRIKVNSELGKGTVFTVELPQE